MKTNKKADIMPAKKSIKIKSIINTTPSYRDEPKPYKGFLGIAQVNNNQSPI
jgi:hypothetical protein